jgi:alkylated DNA nucleotide flippase Atl1
LDSITMTARERASAIRKTVRAIRRGSFVSYGEVARRAGLPGRARLVGQVLRESGDEPRLPWHRVTGAGGAHRLSGRIFECTRTTRAIGARRGADQREPRARQAGARRFAQPGRVVVENMRPS